MQIKKTTDITHFKLKGLSVGPPGAGKTTFACSMAKAFPTLVLSAEAGLLSALNIKGDDGKPLPIDFIEIETFEDIETVYNHLKMKAVVDGHDYGKYQAVAMDSITEIQDKCLQSIMAKTKNEAMQIQDWGVLANRIERMVRSFRDLPLHLVVTALEEPETDKLTGEVKVWPMLKGSVQRKLPAYFDLVLYHYGKEVEVDGKKKTVPCVLTCNSGKYQGKDRSGKLPQTMQAPDFKIVFETIFGKQQKGSL